MVIKKRCLFSVLALLIMPLFLAPANTAQAKDVNPEDCYFGSTIQNPDKATEVNFESCYNETKNKILNNKAKAIGNKNITPQLSIDEIKDTAKKGKFECAKKQHPSLEHLEQCVDKKYCFDKNSEYTESGSEASIRFNAAFICTRAWRHTKKVSPKICADLANAQDSYNNDNNILYWHERDGESGNKKGQSSDLLKACRSVKGCNYDTKKKKITCEEAKKLVKENKPFAKSVAENPDNESLDANTTTAPLDDDSTDPTGFNNSCKRGGGILSFILCPAINLMLGVIDMTTKLIADNLKWTFLADAGGSTAIYNTWSKMRDIANIILAIAFIVMLYIYAINVDNKFKAYTIKQALSRLVIIAICMQLSFYICAALADLSNIAGVGIYELFTKQLGGDASLAFGANTFKNAFRSILASIAILFAVIFSFSSLIMIICAILAMVALRQVILVTLTLLAPLALACYLLPNTEKWFKKWGNSFIQLLIVYPFFTAAWGGCQLVASVIENMMPVDKSNPISGFGFVIAPLCAIAPLALIMPIFKMSSSMMGKVTGKVQGAMDKTGISGFAKSRDQARRTAAKNRLEIGNLKLQNHLSRKGHKLTAAMLSYTNGTRAAYISNRSDELTKDLQNKTVSTINAKRVTTKQIVTAPIKALRNKKVNDKFIELSALTKDPNVELDISDKAAAEIATVTGSAPLKSTIDSDGKKRYTINGSILVQYQAMTGNNADGKKLSQSEYQASLECASLENLLNNNQLHYATLNVQNKGDETTRKSFIDSYTDYNDGEWWTGNGKYSDYDSYKKANNNHIFMDDKSKQDFIKQTGDFKAGSIKTGEDLDKALRNSRRAYVNNINTTDYGNLGETVRTELLEKSVKDGDLDSVTRIERVNEQFIRSNARSGTDLKAIRHAYNIKYSINTWRKGSDNERYKTW